MHKLTGLIFTLFTSIVQIEASAAHQDKQPNVIIIYTDDQGYQDLGCYGSPKIKTPVLDGMAKEGIRFTDFYVTASVCCPTRASLLTGRYSVRNGVGGVILPDSEGLADEEVTLAEILKDVGYHTACFGKWHVGDIGASHPLRQGFDVYHGLLYSNDMHLGGAHEFAKNAVFREGYTLEKAKADQAFNTSHPRNEINDSGRQNLVPLFEGVEIVEYPCDQGTLTRRYFDRAIEFIDAAEDDPFFLYLTPNMPHIPLYVSEQFKGTSERGLYGDVIEEIDWNTGRLLNHLKQRGIDENTLVIFTSDNGPWLGYGDHAGSAEPLRDGKFSNYEGGVRVPCIMRWPGRWPAGVETGAIVSILDFLPTLANYAGARVDSNRLDGMNIAPFLEYPAKGLDRDVMLYTKGERIVGIRKGDWKYLPHGGGRQYNESNEPELFNLRSDVGETQNLVDDHPEIVEQLGKLLTKMFHQMKD